LRDGNAGVQKKSTRGLNEFGVEPDEIVAVDPQEFMGVDVAKPAVTPKAAPSERLKRRHPGVSIFYFSVPAMATFALGLPVLMAGGSYFVRGGHVYVAVYTICALSLLMLTSLSGLRQYFRSRRVEFPPGIGWFWLGLGSVMIAAVMTGALQLPLPSMPKAASIAAHEYDYWRPNSTFELVISPASATADLVEETKIVERVGQGVLLFMGLFVLFGAVRALGVIAISVARNPEWYPGWVIDLVSWLDRVLQRIVRLPESSKRGRPKRIRPEVSQSAPYRNPLSGQSGDSPEAVRDYVAVSYDALCALAADLGVPREKDQTPYEFLRVFPRELRGLRAEARELTDMYVRSAYSQLSLDDTALDRLRKFWMTFERIRSRYVR